MCEAVQHTKLCRMAGWAQHISHHPLRSPFFVSPRRCMLCSLRACLRAGLPGQRRRHRADAQDFLEDRQCAQQERAHRVLRAMVRFISLVQPRFSTAPVSCQVWAPIPVNIACRVTCQTVAQSQPLLHVPEIRSSISIVAPPVS